MPTSIEQRIFRLVLVVNILLLGSILLFAWWSLEELEAAMLESDHEAEIQFFVENGEKDKVQRVVTAQIISAFIPAGTDVDSNLPLVFKNVAVPYQGEVVSLDKEYFVVTTRYPEGTYYLAKDLALFEEREESLTFYILLLALVLAVTCYGLALVFSKRISRPVTEFAHRLAASSNLGSKLVIPESNIDAELNEIARAMNHLFQQLDDAMQRERTLISMASHELRTPVSVVLGAARVMESRQHLQPDDQKTLQRIIVAAEEMSANIRALLALVRQNPQDLKREPVNLVELLTTLSHDCELANPTLAGRIQLQLNHPGAVIYTDAALVRMLFNNLIGNALQHTSGSVTITRFEDHVAVCDQGPPMPVTQLKLPTDYKPASGLGLYIVSLICEHLHWKLQMDTQEQGQCIRIYF